jgi:hypothetical protein
MQYISNLFNLHPYATGFRVACGGSHRRSTSSSISAYYITIIRKTSNQILVFILTCGWVGMRESFYAHLQIFPLLSFIILGMQASRLKNNLRHVWFLKLQSCWSSLLLSLINSIANRAFASFLFLSINTSYLRIVIDYCAMKISFFFLILWYSSDQHMNDVWKKTHSHLYIYSKYQ